MNKSIFYILLLAALPLWHRGAERSTSTNMTIKDSVRHCTYQSPRSATRYHVYHHQHGRRSVNHFQKCNLPVAVSFWIKVHIIIPKTVSRQFKATYNSIKNVGEVVHPHPDFRQYALPKWKAELKFDVNVIPDADYTRVMKNSIRISTLKTALSGDGGRKRIRTRILCRRTLIISIKY